MKHIKKLNELIDSKKIKISIIGLGYVGLPLAVEFGKQYKTIGFDVNNNRIAALIDGHDVTGELSQEQINNSENIFFTNEVNDIQDSNIYIVTVPTPVDKYKKPDFKPLHMASQTVGKIIKEGDVVIYESTVYPGATEEECIPILEKYSDLKYNVDFYAGYSPERINPGDKDRTVIDILKITSGSNSEIATVIDNLYKSIIIAGTYKASSIKVAEAAKVIENVQRDVNIGLINELALLFNRLDIDTEEVLKAAGTKWNFLNFRPGLVGGHCIGVDPYYLTHKAESVDFYPEIILSGRKTNDSMGPYVANTLVKEMLKRDFVLKNTKALIMGFSFKENCHDVRNTKIIDIINELNDYGMSVDCYDPWVDEKEVMDEYNIHTIPYPKPLEYDAVILAVAHSEFKDMTIKKIKEFCKDIHLIYDLKYLFPKDDVDLRL